MVANSNNRETPKLIILSFIPTSKINFSSASFDVTISDIFRQPSRIKSRFKGVPSQAWIRTIMASSASSSSGL